MEDDSFQTEFRKGAEFQFRLFNSVSFLMAFVIALLGVAIAQVLGLWYVGLPFYILALAVLVGLKIALEWERAVVLRMGRLRNVSGPGYFWVMPGLDRVAAWIDQRMMATAFGAEKTLTRDTVPVDVDAVLFWVVWDAHKAALEVKDYRLAIFWAAQTALRDIIGRMDLADILVGRERIDEELQQIIDRRTTPWGITVESVEIRDIVIPEPLEAAMSRRAQAERERQARIILGDAEKQIAESFVEAAKIYADEPMALRLRSLNMIMEGVRERGSLVVVPYDESHSLDTIAGLVALEGKHREQVENNQEA